VRDVALVPQRNILKAGLRVAAHHSPRPLICSLVTGFRLCGMADEPFCFSLKNSSTSRTSFAAGDGFRLQSYPNVEAITGGWRDSARAVTLDYLRRYGGRLQTQTRADLLFNFRR